MVKISFQQKPYRKVLMETYGARSVASPSTETASGRAILEQNPDSNGSLGIAISEAVEVGAQNDDAKYALGIEAIKQLEMAGDYPDVIVGCTGGGSNLAGVTFTFLGQKLRGGQDIRIVAVEPAACPTLTRGQYAYDFGDTGHLTPLVKMHTLGSTFIPPGSSSPAPVVNHAVKGAIGEALRCKAEGKSETILFNLCATAISTCRLIRIISPAIWSI